MATIKVPAHKRQRNPAFLVKWGIHAAELAESEGVECATIHMRVMRFGTPFQRRARPTKYERAYARTAYEIAEEMGAHPITIMDHHKHQGNAYRPLTLNSFGQVLRRPRSTLHWRDQCRANPKWAVQSPWLMPQHPDHDAWRRGELFPEEYQGGSQLTVEEVHEMMRDCGWPRYQLLTTNTNVV